MLALNARRVSGSLPSQRIFGAASTVSPDVWQKLAQDPFSGGVFVFCNRRRTAVKLLVYDGQGFWLCQSGCRRGTTASGPGVRGSSSRRTPWRSCSREATTPRPAESRVASGRPDLRERSPQTELPKAGRHPPQRDTEDDLSRKD
ncbi:MAG: IS66 family insertion sequence element accessory protein TnpB [Candidatus Accumulibacter sp.]|uniref:IS66 family insertion sequence element accessory protein TnpB n=1 Tax=Candidatus Accumulibacter proximus TaxID=2954385 RepID=A0A935Q3G3_9PROT|nr:IS66 family insertion sequence element accessory protein TnpB [Candidatus Accumulibacter proximus]